MKKKRYKYSPGGTSKYLTRMGIEFIRKGDELLVKCIFSGCDDDSCGQERHLSLNDNTGLYQCFKCGARGNFITLKNFFKGGNYGK